MPRTATQQELIDKLLELTGWLVERPPEVPSVLNSGIQYFLRWAARNWDVDDPVPLVPPGTPVPKPPPPTSSSTAVGMTFDIQPST